MRVEHLKHKEQISHETKKTGTNRPTLAQSRRGVGARQNHRGCLPGATDQPGHLPRWKQKYGGLSVQEAKRLKELELENAKLKRLLAESMLANDALQEFLSKKA